MPKVTFHKSGHSLSLTQNDELIELDYKDNNELPFGCKSAACGTCALEVVSGIENLNSKNEEEQELLDALNINGKNRRLGCQCLILGDIVIDPLNG